ncbi:MAG: phasin family protein [Pseudomonadota bacterium]
MATKKSQTQAEDMFKSGIDSIAKNVDTFSSFAKDNLDAMMQSANIAAKGAEKITAEAVAASKQNMEQTIAAAKEFSNVRTIDQFVTIQTQLSKQAFEQCVEQATKLGDLFISVSKEASEPLDGRLNAFSEQFTKKAS